MNQTVIPQQYAEYADISLVAIARAIRRYWYLLLAAVVLAVGAGTAYAFLTSPKYESTILITPVSGGSSGGNISRLLQNFGASNIFSGFGATASGRNARAVSLAALSSPFFTRAFIEEENLLPVLFSDRWNAEEGTWAVDTPDDIPTLSDAYDLFSNDILEVIDDSISGLVTVKITWGDPVLAARWANLLVEKVNERLREKAISDADLTIQYLNEELAKTNAVELQQALYFLVESEIQKKTIAKVQQEYAFAVLSPAIPPDPDKYAHPNRPFIIAASGLAGILGGLIVVFIASAISTVRKEFSARS